MKHFLSCDWGTSNFRLRLISTPDLEVLAEVTSNQGIAETFKQWQSGGADEQDRVAHYLSIIKHKIREVSGQGFDLSGVAVVLSGMASSNIGLMSLPYQNLPFNLIVPITKHWFRKRSDDFPHDLLLISGVKSADDIMRGEETQMAGLIQYSSSEARDLYILPGTHSKHIDVFGGEIVDFKTYLTGELFALLNKSSTLQTALAPAKLYDSDNLKCFRQGITNAAGRNVLHSLFNVRAANVLGTRSPQQGYCYLSGLLIGTEIKDIVPDAYDQVYFYCADPLKSIYLEAFKILGLNDKVAVLPDAAVDRCVVKGQYLIYKSFMNYGN